MDWTSKKSKALLHTKLNCIHLRPMRVSRLLVYSPSNGNGRSFAKTSPFTPPQKKYDDSSPEDTCPCSETHLKKASSTRPGFQAEKRTCSISSEKTSFERMKCLEKRQHAENKKNIVTYISAHNNKKTSKKKKKKTTFGMSPKLRPSDVVVLEDLHQRRHLSFVSVDLSKNSDQPNR